METPLVMGKEGIPSDNGKWRRAVLFVAAGFAITFILVVGIIIIGGKPSRELLRRGDRYQEQSKVKHGNVIESELGAVAADDARCSEIGASMLRKGGHAVDAAVAAALCLGVVNPASSGIGGGSFMIVRSSSTSKAEAFDMRETAPSAATQNMYENKPQEKSLGALSMGVPGELAGLHEAWSKYGRLSWKTLFEPAIRLAKEGFTISHSVGHYIASFSEKIMNDPGLMQVFAPKGHLLRAGDRCNNTELGLSLEVLAEEGPQAFYNGIIGKKFVKDVQQTGGILTIEDLKNYKVKVTDAMAVNLMGYTVYGMPPPSSGTLGLALVLNIFNSYKSSDAAKGNLGLHRLIEALKHMFAVRMNLGDPDFVNITDYENAMLSPSFAKKLQQKIVDNTTFPPEYYLNRWSQLRDHGTSHLCVVDAERNAVSLTSTVNSPFGAGIISTSTGMVLNNEMDDFSAPTELSPDKLPPAPTNFIQPNKRPLSSMTPIVVTKDGQLVAVLGGSGGLKIIPAVAQVFINYFALGMEPLAAIQSARVYHKLIPNVVQYEDLTAFDGSIIDLSEEKQVFLKDRGHELNPIDGGAVTQFIIQNLESPIQMDGKNRYGFKPNKFRGILTAVSDPRKGGKPAAI